MRHSFIALCTAALAIFAIASCNDDTSTIGSSLSGQNVEIVIDSSFTVSGHTVRVARIKPKTTEQLIGRIDIPAFGSLGSDVVTQFLPSTALDTANFGPENVDSIYLSLQYLRGSFIGDSVAPMQLTVYALNKQLPADTITSGFKADGYYDTKPLATKIYNTSSANESEEAQKLNYGDISVKLPTELGKNLFKAFVDKPSDYANGQTFAQNVFPGMYLRTTFGGGRITRIAQSTMSMYLRKIYTPEGSEKPDTLDAVHTYYMVTPEVVSNNDLTYIMSATLSDMIADGHTMMIAPSGAEVELEFPIKDIIKAYSDHKQNLAVINGLAMTVPVDTIENGFGIAPPPYALLVLKKDRDAFFEQNKLTDNVTSFYAAYNETTRSYSFNALRSYLTDMLDREEIKPEDYTFSLVPVQVNFESTASSGYYGSSSQVESEILPYLVTPAMADIRLDKAKIKFTYSLQTQK